MRFLDMEGGPAIFAEPNEIAERYHKVLQQYLADVKAITSASAIDYHRVSTDTPYEHTLMRFLVGRTRGGGSR